MSARAARAIPLVLGAIVVAAPLAGGALEALVHAACGPLCHQDPARSFALAGRALPLCARCTGVLAGVALVSLGWGSRGLGDTRAWPLLVALGALDPFLRALALDHAVERLVLGTILGAGVALGAVRVAQAAHEHARRGWSRLERARAIARGR